MVRLALLALSVSALACQADFSEHEAYLTFRDRHIAAKKMHDEMMARHAAVNEKHGNFVDAFNERTQVPAEAARILDEHRVLLTAHAGMLNQHGSVVDAHEQFVASVAAGSVASEEGLLAAIAEFDAQHAAMTQAYAGCTADYTRVEKEHTKLEHLTIADRDEPEGLEPAAAPEAVAPVEKRKNRKKGKRRGKKKRKR